MATQQPLLTDLEPCLKDDCIARWPDRAMPLSVNLDELVGSQLHWLAAAKALKGWEQLSNGLIRFTHAEAGSPAPIQITFGASSLPQGSRCYRYIDSEHAIQAASIRLDPNLTDPESVERELFHQVGQALGLTQPLAPKALNTLRWLYRLPVGFDYHAYARSQRLEGIYSIDELIRYWSETPTQATSTRPALQMVSGQASKPSLTVLSPPSRPTQSVWQLKPNASSPFRPTASNSPARPV
jgi:hypothetical protein